MENEQRNLATYVNDMLAVERHMRIAFDTQGADKSVIEYSDGAEIVKRLLALSDMHIDALVAQLNRLGAQETSPIKSALTQVEGALAGAVDKVRKTKVSRSLRDDCAALALCSIGYSELLATANGLHDSGIAELAKRHLSDYANALMKVSEYMPGIVMRELQASGVDIDSATVDASRHDISECWQQTSRPFHESAATTDVTAP